MKLSQWAKSKNIHYQTAYGMFKRGQIPGAYQLATGTIVIPEKTEQDLLKEAIQQTIREEVQDEVRELKTTIEELKTMLIQHNQDLFLKKVKNKTTSTKKTWL